MTESIKEDLARFFQGRESAFKLFERVRKLVEKRQSPRIEVSKTQVSFRERYPYLWVWLPQTWIDKRPESSITLTILTGEKIRSKRIAASVQPKPGYWTHHIILEQAGDIDEEVEDLIQKSIAFYLARLEHRQRKNR